MSEQEHQAKCLKHEVEIAILKEKIAEMVKDKEKASQWQMRLVSILAGLAFSIAGSAVVSYSKIAVLTEKVAEQKEEIIATKTYASDLENALFNALSDHELNKH